MDDPYLVETAMVVMENKRQSRDNVNILEEQLKKCDEYLDFYREKLVELQTTSTARKEHLEVNNYLKTETNDHYNKVKFLIQKVYPYIQQIHRDLERAEDNNHEALFTQNDQLFKKREADFDKILQSDERSISKSLVRLDGQKSAVMKSIEDTKGDTEGLESDLKSLRDQHDEILQEIYGLDNELNSLENQVNLKHKQVEEHLNELKANRDSGDKEVEDLANEVKAVKDKVSREQDEITMERQAMNSIMEQSNDVVQQKMNLFKVLEEIKNGALAAESKQHCVKQEFIKTRTILGNDILVKNEVAAQIKATIVTTIKKTEELQNSVNQFGIKLSEVQVDLENKEREFNENEGSEQDLRQKTDALALNNEQIAFNIAKVTQEFTNYNCKISELQLELTEIQSNHNQKMQAILSENDRLKSEADKNKQSLSGTIDSIEKEKNRLKQAIVDEENSIKICKNQSDELASKSDELTKNLRAVDVQCDNMRKEIKRLEAEADKINKIKIPKAPFQRMRTSTPQNKTMLDDSDSSVDGDKLSYSDLMKRKRQAVARKQAQLSKQKKK